MQELKVTNKLIVRQKWSSYALPTLTKVFVYLTIIMGLHKADPSPE